MSGPAKLESNPEILLKKRKNADRQRVEKQEQARRRAVERRKKAFNTKKSGKFVRAETIVARKLASEREKQRVKRIERFERLHPSEEENETLLLVVRIQNPHMGKVPFKAQKVLNALRLKNVNDGTFVKLNEKIRPLLKFVNPYVVVGNPSLATVRSLVQKRATVKVGLNENENENKEQGEVIAPAGYDSAEVEGTDYKIIALNDNNLIEEKLGHIGVICQEDIIHEIYRLGDSFREVVQFMEPFHLKEPVFGWNSLSKFKRMQLEEKNKNSQVSAKANADLNEVDIDKYIAEQI